MIHVIPPADENDSLLRFVQQHHRTDRGLAGRRILKFL
jgi:hypothetical protein